MGAGIDTRVKFARRGTQGHINSYSLVLFLCIISFLKSREGQVSLAMGILVLPCSKQLTVCGSYTYKYNLTCY